MNIIVWLKFVLAYFWPAVKYFTHYATWTHTHTHIYIYIYIHPTYWSLYLLEYLLLHFWCLSHHSYSLPTHQMQTNISHPLTHLPSTQPILQSTHMSVVLFTKIPPLLSFTLSIYFMTINFSMHHLVSFST